MKETYDFGIIGAGGTGLAAAMYAARLGLKTVCFGASHGSEMPVGGVITTTNVVENYPGFIRLTGTELANKIKEHAESYDLVNIKEERVNEIKKDKTGFIISAEKDYHVKSILIATGTKWRTLNIPGSKEFENRGVAYCALCDAPLYRNKTVAVVGGADTAAKDALVLAEHAKKIYIIYRGDKIRPEPINLQRIEQSKKIEVITKTNVLEVKGSQTVEKLVLDKVYKGSKELSVEGVFVAIGHEILSELAIPLGVKLNEKREIIIDHKTSETNVPGIYAAGDVADKPFKQAITGVAEGCTAAYSAYEYITKNKILSS
mgnify:CR=1 FL=1